MKRREGLAWKVTVTFLIFLIPIIIATGVITRNLFATRQTVEYLNTITIRKMQILSSFDANYQRLLATIGVFALHGDEREGDEANELIAELQQTIAQSEAIYAMSRDELGSTLQGYIDMTQYESLERQRANQLNLLIRIAQDVFSREQPFTPSERDALIENLSKLETANRQLQSESAQLAQIESNAVLRTLNDQLWIVTLTFGVMLGLLLALMGLALWLARRTLVVPINQLAQVTEAVANGQLDQQVAVTNKDELGILQDNFNAMIASIRAQRIALERQNTVLEKERHARKQAQQKSAQDS